MYRYIQIGRDAAYSQSLPRERIENQLRAFPEVVADNLHGFKNSGTAPWFRINVGNCDANGNYPAGHTQNGSMANMIELICAEPGDEDTTHLAHSIATSLGWIIVSDDA